MKFEIYYDAFQEARWFQDLSPYFKDADLKPITTSDSEEVNRLLRYDKPDIILLADGKAVLSLEKTTEVPTGHNIGQRFGRIVCAAEEGVLGIYFGPFLAMKHGAYSGPCWINIRQLQAMLKLWEIHKTPSLAVNWPCDSSYELIRNGEETKELKAVLASYIESKLSVETKEIDQVKAEMIHQIDSGIKRKKGYSIPPPSAVFRDTIEYKNDTRLSNYRFNDEFLKRDKTLHYKVGMKAGLRSDPFTGTQLVYDYAYCRNGATKKDRNINLVMEIPDLKLSDWNNVTNNKRKDKRLLSEFVDLLLLNDGYVTL